MTQLSPVRKRIPSHRIFCSLCFIARGYKPIGPDLQLSLLTRIQLWDWSRGTINCQTESRPWLENRGKRKVCVRKLPGWMWDDWSSITMSQRLRKGTGKGKLVNLFLIAVKFGFSLLPLGQRKGGDVQGRKGFLGETPYVSACVWFFFCFSF